MQLETVLRSLSTRNFPWNGTRPAFKCSSTSALRPKHTLVLKRFPHGNHLWVIYQQHADRRFTDPCQRFQHGSVPNEMFCPLVASRMEEANNFSAVRIDPSDVRSLEAIAMDTSEGEILKLCFAPVLPRNNVIYLEGCWVKCRRQPTVFTASGGSLPNPADEISVQCAWLLTGALQSTASFRLDDGEEVTDMEIAVEFSLFLTRQLPLTSQLG